MSTYELIRQLAKLDPSGTMPVMLSVRTTKEAVKEASDIYDACGFIMSFAIEGMDEHNRFLVIEAVDG